MQNTILNVYRGDLVENSHQGHVAVVDREGNLLYSFGNPYRITHGRSALKLFQVLPVIETGAADFFGLSDADLALCASSHSGERQHQTRVTSILKRAGLDIGALQCGTSNPIDVQTYEHMIRQNQPMTPVCNECSGVHAGMLATAVFKGEDTDSYMEEYHSIQQRVKHAVADLTCMSESQLRTATDGCGIPTYCMPLHHIGWGFARLSDPALTGREHSDAVDRIVRACLSHPEMVTGEKTYSTRVIQKFKGRILVKEGSQGVFGITDLETKIGIAIKVEDGRKDELPPVLNRILYLLGIGVGKELDALREHTNPGLKDTNQDTVGQFKAEFSLCKHG